MDITQLSLDEIRELRRSVQRFATMKKQLGKRGEALFARELAGKKLYTVEYVPTMSEDDAWQQSQKVFSKSFWETPAREEVIFLPKDSLKWGMKVYVDDHLVDMSYSRVEKTLTR